MPYRRTYKRKKRVYKRKKSSFAHKTTVPRPRLYKFNRTSESLLALELPDAEAGWVVSNDGCVMKTLMNTLSELPSYGEFTSLYAQYRLDSLILKIWPTFSEIASTGSSMITSNLICTIFSNTEGIPLINTFLKSDLNQVQRKRQFLVPSNKPFYIRMKLKQLSELYRTPLSTAFGVVNPRFLSTNDSQVPHYSSNLHFSKVDLTAFTSDSPRFLIQQTLYFSMKQVF